MSQNRARTVFLLAHTGRPAAIRSAELVVKGLLRSGLGVRVLEYEARDLPLPDEVELVKEATPQCLDGCELLIVLGGDGTLLRAGAAHVVAVDVGYGQLAWSLQSDERVTVKDRTNVRELTLEAIDGEPVDLVVGDLSFIPLGLVLPALVRCVKPDADLVMMVKPQFEVGKERLGSGGVVRSAQLRAEAVRGVAAKAAELGLGVNGVTASPLPGPSGNVEYFLWLRAGDRKSVV